MVYSIPLPPPPIGIAYVIATAQETIYSVLTWANLLIRSESILFVRTSISHLGAFLLNKNTHNAIVFYLGVIVILFVRISILFYFLVGILVEFPQLVRFKVSDRLEISRFCLGIQKIGRKI